MCACVSVTDSCVTLFSSDRLGGAICVHLVLYAKFMSCLSFSQTCQLHRQEFVFLARAVAGLVSVQDGAGRAVCCGSAGQGRVGRGSWSWCWMLLRYVILMAGTTSEKVQPQAPPLFAQVGTQALLIWMAILRPAPARGWAPGHIGHADSQAPLPACGSQQGLGRGGSRVGDRHDATRQC